MALVNLAYLEHIGIIKSQGLHTNDSGQERPSQDAVVEHATVPSVAPVKPLSEETSRVSHGFVDESLPTRLDELGVPLLNDPCVGQKNAEGRLEGHSTHNFFVHDKKNKDKRFLVTVRQASKIEIKSLASILGVKELRMCTEGETLLKSKKGCITPLSLFYDVEGKVPWIVDELLLGETHWRLGTSSMDSESTVVDIGLQNLETLLKVSGHWVNKTVKTFD